VKTSRRKKNSESTKKEGEIRQKAKASRVRGQGSGSKQTKQGSVEGGNTRKGGTSTAIPRSTDGFKTKLTTENRRPGGLVFPTRKKTRKVKEGNRGGKKGISFTRLLLMGVNIHQQR